MRKFETGYASIEEGYKDKFAKIGGMVRAMSTLETGWYQLCQRKEMNVRNARRQELFEKDPLYADLRARVDAQLKTKKRA